MHKAKKLYENINDKIDKWFYLFFKWSFMNDIWSY